MNFQNKAWWAALDSAQQAVLVPDPAVCSRLYYEAHVTVPPLNQQQLEQVDGLCQAMGWRRSTFELHKDGLVPNAFVSARHENRDSIVGMTAEMCHALRHMGLQVLRWKIEDTLLDSNKGDQLLVRSAQHTSVEV